MKAPNNLVTSFTRRSFLGTTLAGTGYMTATMARVAPVAGAVMANKYQGLKSDPFLGKVSSLSRVEDDMVFTEGPAADRTGHLYFTNVPVSRILKWDPEQRELSVFRENSNKANGLYFDPQGRLLACEGGLGRVTRTDMKTGKIEVLASEFKGFPFAPSNDLCLDAQGRVYFTSRPGTMDPAKGNVNAVYRIDADGSVDQLLHWPDVHMPNGIVISPDNKTLYLIEAHPDADRHRDIRAYDLLPNGKLVNGRVLINFYPHALLHHT